MEESLCVSVYVRCIRVLLKPQCKHDTIHQQPKNKLIPTSTASLHSLIRIYFLNINEVFWEIRATNEDVRGQLHHCDID